MGFDTIEINLVFSLKKINISGNTSRNTKLKTMLRKPSSEIMLSPVLMLIKKMGKDQQEIKPTRRIKVIFLISQYQPSGTGDTPCQSASQLRSVHVMYVIYKDWESKLTKDSTKGPNQLSTDRNFCFWCLLVM